MFLRLVTIFTDLAFAASMIPPGRTYLKMFMTRTSSCVRGIPSQAIMIGEIMKIAVMLETGLLKYSIVGGFHSKSLKSKKIRDEKPIESKKSERWTFPDLFYTVDSILEDGTKQRIIMIDTTLLSGIYGAEKPDDPNGKPENR